MFRNTYVEINLKNIKHNIKTFINKYNNYQYYFGVVKADCYGHFSIMTVKSIIEAGCNYLAVSSLDEALEIRKYIDDIPILCLETINTSYLNLCIKNNITITISNMDYLEKILQIKLDNLKVHLKIDTGMNRLGLRSKEEVTKSFHLIKNSSLYLEGIYTHMYDALNEEVTNKQFAKFVDMTSDINLKEIPIIHLTASTATMKYPKKDFVNGCRLGIIMYGLSELADEAYLSTFKVVSNILQINKVNKETVGYGGMFKADSPSLVAVIPIGYADGIIRKNTGRNVYINNKPYPIVGNICMDMLFVLVDETVHVNDQVLIIKDNNHIREIAEYLDTIPYEVICSIGKRVPRVYVEK